MKTEIESSNSFRDPSGFLFWQEGVLHRQINPTYSGHYSHLMSSGLYEALAREGMLIPHEEVSDGVIKPEPVHFISYPYEWCFSQLKDAALLTLDVQTRALGRGMILKDSSAYNIQFHKGTPILIDTLSFEVYREGEPWAAYRQFCEHFLAPLALMGHKDVRLGQLLRIHLDGIPLDLTSSLLPLHTRLIPYLALHIFAHSKAQGHYADKSPIRRISIAPTSLLGLIDTLKSAIGGLKWKPKGTWSDYSPQDEYIGEKKRIVGNYLSRIKPRMVWDLGANTGVFSRLASDKNIPTLSLDADPACVELNYIATKKNGDTNLLPLLMDLTNPSPGVGWKNEERTPLWGRGKADTVLALALIHHLAISNNLPLGMLADFFRPLSPFLIVEFVPKSDANAQRLLVSKRDVFPDYTREAFEWEFTKRFRLRDVARIGDSGRTLYLMEAHP